MESVLILYKIDHFMLTYSVVVENNNNNNNEIVIYFNECFWSQ